MCRLFLVITLLMSSFATAQAMIVQSALDKKLYRALILDNNLKVLLISDSNADNGAASLDVHVGSSADPRDWNGLAHFLEHMLFLGTKKYPEADAYHSFIKNNGGRNNAYTSSHHTNYYFSIKPDLLLPALDRFSRFFIDPTFDALYVDRERAIVHSEYRARRKNESRRIWDAEKRLLDPTHPVAGFSVGSENTLRDRLSSSARDKLIAFYEQYYSANIMTLVVLGPQSLDQLQQWVTERFGLISNKHIPVPVFDQPYMNAELMPARLNILPDKEKNSLRFQFPIPSTMKEYRSKPVGYIANLLGHEGDGSLLNLLKELGWAERLSAGTGYMDAVNGTIMVSIDLTEEGLNRIVEIGEFLFQYIALIENQGIERWRYDEESQLAEISFQFAQTTSAGHLVQSLSSRLHDYPVFDVLKGPYRMDEFKVDLIKTMLTRLTPENVNLTVVSKQVDTELQTEYYDVDYSIKPLEAAIVTRWVSSRQGQTQVDHRLSLPQANPFIPLRLTAQPLAPISERPVLQQNTGKLSVWYRADPEFDAPRASFYFNVMSPVANQSARHRVMNEILVRLWNEQLNKAIYPAYLAGLEYSLYRHSRGFSVRIDGYEDRQSTLLEMIVGAVSQPEFDSDKLALIKADLKRQWINSQKASPSDQSIREVYQLVIQPYWTEQDRLAVISSISIEDLMTYLKEFMSRVKVVVLSHGDVTLEKTRERTALLETLFDESEIIETIQKPLPRKLSDAKPYLRSLEINHSDSVLTIYFQGDAISITEKAKMALLGQLIESPYYHRLRTTNRVGYLMFATSLPILELPGLLLSAQSPTHSPLEIDRLISQFLLDFKVMLRQMDVTEFDQAKQGLISHILKSDKRLSERSARYWREIDLGEWQFDLRESLAEQVDKLSQEDILVFFEAVMLERPRQLRVQSAGLADGIADELIDSKGHVVIENVSDFRQH